ncbi:hypothetical protein F0562_035947 [Nyssa sinensis]|uniref:Cytochrome P450 n=1 Tax=Nyssa sinensis TaxID=561372 RepID=A0A5J5AFJ8_9ASTE|nr:hypothetical protein F0562_035947 [Nyssa sinensis]
MEFLLSSSTTIVAIVAFLVFLYHLVSISKIAKRNTGQNTSAAPPEAAGAWPIMGHLHLLGGSQLPHKTLASMADKYGPIFSIKLGLHQALVVSDCEIAKECFTTNDKVFANRPKSVAVELLSYNYAMFGFASYSPYWRQMRKIVMSEFLSNRRLEMLEDVRVSEVKESIKEIYQIWVKNRSDDSNKVKVEMKQWLGDLTLNTVVRMLVGKRCLSDEEDGVRFQKANNKFFEQLGMFLVSDAFPFLRWFDLGGHEKAMKKTAREMDFIVQGWLDEHKRKRDSGQVKEDQQDFMDVMLSIFYGVDKAEDLPAGFDADTIIKATFMVILGGSIDTTIATMTWALSLLLNNQQALRKAQEELDIHVGSDRQVESSDLKNLINIQAILKETLRLYPITGPRESMEDCIVGGYKIPKGTRLLVNFWKLHRDPRVWSDPSEFQPERFLTSHKDVDVRGQHFEFIPFGSGRRMCPGTSLAMQHMELTLASLLHGFEFETPLNEPIDMTQSFGQTNPKATPLEVLLTPRLASNLYGNY